MQRRIRKFAGLVSAVALAGTTSVFGTTLEKMTMEDMAQGADIVVVGSPTDSVVVRDNGQIVTKTTIAIAGDAFGGAPSSVTVVTPGGRLTTGKIQGAEIVAGAPAFPGGRDVMLFLNAAEDGNYHVTGFNQGYFNVVDGEVKFAPSDGGATEIADAFELVRQARAADADQQIEE